MLLYTLVNDKVPRANAGAKSLAVIDDEIMVDYTTKSSIT